MNKKRWFTLIEILVALAVFAVLAVITSSALYNTFHTRTRLIQYSSKLNALQITFAMLQQDITNMVDRTVHESNMKRIVPFIGQPSYIEFTRTGSSLQRVALFCQNDHLIRRTWLRLDTPNRKQVRDQILLSSLAQCRFSYFDRSLQSLSEWRSTQLPNAVQLSLAISGRDSLDFLFIIPESLYADVS